MVMEISFDEMVNENESGENDRKIPGRPLTLAPGEAAAIDAKDEFQIAAAEFNLTTFDLIVQPGNPTASWRASAPRGRISGAGTRLQFCCEFRCCS
jgi:hypothetical protein